MPQAISVNALNQQMDDFVRSVCIKYFFHDPVNVSSYQYRKFYAKSKWNG